MASDIKFKATDIELTEITGFIGFVDDLSDHYFWMQPGETDSGFNPNKEEIWLERDDQGWGGQGKEWKIYLTRNKFTLDASKLDFLQCNNLVVDFDISDEEHETLISLIKKIMSECPQDLIINA